MRRKQTWIVTIEVTDNCQPAPCNRDELLREVRAFCKPEPASGLKAKVLDAKWQKPKERER